MKPQLYSIVILLLTRSYCAENTGKVNSTLDAVTSNPQPALFTTNNNNTSVAESPADNVTSVTQAPNDQKTSAPDDNATSVTKASKGNAMSVTKASEVNATTVTSRETIVSESPADKVTVLSEAPNSNATAAPSLAPNRSPVTTTKGFTRTTGSASVSIKNQTSNPIVAGNATTLRIKKVPTTVRKTKSPASTKPTTGKSTENRTSVFPVPSLFAIVLLVVSVLCF